MPRRARACFYHPTLFVFLVGFLGFLISPYRPAEALIGFRVILFTRGVFSFRALQGRAFVIQEKLWCLTRASQELAFTFPENGNFLPLHQYLPRIPFAPATRLRLTVLWYHLAPLLGDHLTPGV